MRSRNSRLAKKAENIRFPDKNSDYYKLVYGDLYLQMNQKKEEIEKGFKEAWDPKGNQGKEETLRAGQGPIRLAPSTRIPELKRFGYGFKSYVCQKEGGGE